MSSTLSHDDVRPVRRSRTWSDNGARKHESSWNGPNGAGFFHSSSRAGTFNDNEQPRSSRGQRGSTLGKVFHGAGTVFSGLQHARSSGKDRRRTQQNVDDRDEGRGSSARSKPIFSRIAASLTEPSPRERREHRRRQQRLQSPHERHRHSAHASPPGSRSAFVEDYSSDSDSDESDCDSYTRNSVPPNPIQVEEALENKIESHRREARAAKRQLHHARRGPRADSDYLDYLAEKVESHEDAEDDALDDLKQLRRDVERKQYEQRRRPRQNHTSRRDTIHDDSDDDDFFNDPLFDDFHGGSGHRQRTSRPQFAGARGFSSGSPFGASPFAAAFESIFADFEQTSRMHQGMHQRFYSSPGGHFTASFTSGPRTSHFSTANGGSSRQRQPSGFTTFSPQPRAPPATVLKPQEAQRLFVTYNERWNNAGPVDLNVPFPARGLTSSNLNSRNTLWAPAVSSPVEAWSDETVMKANTQAFFLGAAGLKPEYSELAGGKIELGIDKSSASPAQVQKLVEILKKERTRWHSDRLGKRNGGRGGTNEALQSDARARAVYHGVCELIEAAQ